MKHNLRILRLNLEIDRLREHLEESRRRNLKLEVKAKKLFEKVKTLNQMQMNSELPKKWGQELDDLETIMEESEVFKEFHSQREIKKLFFNMTKEIAENSGEFEETRRAAERGGAPQRENPRENGQREESEGNKESSNKAKTINSSETEKDTGRKALRASAEARPEDLEAISGKKAPEGKDCPELKPLVEKLNGVDYSLLSSQVAEARLLENPVDLTGWVLDSFELKVRKITRLLEENTESKRSANGRQDRATAELEAEGNRRADQPVHPKELRVPKRAQLGALDEPQAGQPPRTGNPKAKAAGKRGLLQKGAGKAAPETRESEALEDKFGKKRVFEAGAEAGLFRNLPEQLEFRGRVRVLEPV